MGKMPMLGVILLTVRGRLLSAAVGNKKTITKNEHEHEHEHEKCRTGGAGDGVGWRWGSEGHGQDVHAAG